jgi:hypothetical protein
MLAVSIFFVEIFNLNKLWSVIVSLSIMAIMETHKIKDIVDSDAYISLGEALRLLSESSDYSWVPHQRLRAAVRNGEVHSRRSGHAKHSRYYVRMRDLLRAIK